MRIVRLVTVLSVALAASLPVAWAQTAWPLSSLTVPDKDLPGGCQVKPYVAPTTTRVVAQDGRSTTIQPNPGAFTRFPANPWSGSGRSFVIELRKEIDGAPKLPDAPPLSPREIAAADGEWARHVREGYQAIYEAADGERVTVSAIRFDDPRLVSTDPPSVSRLLRMPSGVTERLVKNDVAVRLTASSNHECYQKILAHVRGLQ